MTVQQWIETFGWSVEEVDPKTLRIVCPHLPELPFFARCSEHWLMLAIVPVLDRDGPRPSDISRRLLAVNRDLRLAKFAYDDDGDVAESHGEVRRSLQGLPDRLGQVRPLRTAR